jgi:hypothetical protein
LNCSQRKRIFAIAKSDSYKSRRVIAIASQTTLVRAIDLYHDTILHDDVHGSEPQTAERIANLIQRFICWSGPVVTDGGMNWL